MVESTTIHCPECGSYRIFKDGLRYFEDGNHVQRWLCRNCGFRFSKFATNLDIEINVARQSFEESHSRKDLLQSNVFEGEFSSKPSLENASLKVCKNVASHSQSEQTMVGKALNAFPDCSRECRVCASAKAKNLENQTKYERPSVGGTNENAAGIKGKLLQYSIYMERQGYNSETIRGNSGALRVLLTRGASLFDPETVKDVLAREQRKFENGEKGWSSNRRRNIINSYSLFLKINGLTWEKPKCKTERKNPFMPTEAEINDLIAASPQIVATLLELLKETAMRVGEALRLKWTDIDFEKVVIMLNEPEKGSNPRVYNKSDLSPKLMNMLNALPRINQRVFGGKTRDSLKNTFSRVRARLANKLQNPRLLKVHFHTLRHWALTMYQHKVHDIVLTARFAGHRNINNTMKYLHLEQMLFNDVQDDFIVKTAKTPEEAAGLIEVGFQLEDTIDGVHLYRKRK